MLHNNSLVRYEAYCKRTTFFRYVAYVGCMLVVARCLHVEVLMMQQQCALQACSEQHPETQGAHLQQSVGLHVPEMVCSQEKAMSASNSSQGMRQGHRRCIGPSLMISPYRFALLKGSSGAGTCLDSGLWRCRPPYPCDRNSMKICSVSTGADCIQMALTVCKIWAGM